MRWIAVAFWFGVGMALFQQLNEDPACSMGNRLALSASWPFLSAYRFAAETYHLKTPEKAC